MKYLVIGGDSLVGRSIIAALRHNGKSVVSTSRRTENLSDSCFFLDLKQDISTWKTPNNIDIAFICAGVTSLEKCRADPAQSMTINVKNTVELGTLLLKKGVSIIFPSTNLVFDGEIPKRKIEDPVCPRVEYGIQKAATEKALLDLGEKVSVVRFTKILDPQMPLVHNWLKRLKERKTIFPFYDMVLSPISLDFAIKVILEIAENKCSGIWHISAEKDISYEDLARYVAHINGEDQRYIKAVSIQDSGLEIESNPKHTTLDTSKLKEKLGITPPEVWATLSSLFGPGPPV